MDFQTIKPVPKTVEIIDRALKRARVKSSLIKNRDRFLQTKQRTTSVINICSEVYDASLDKISKEFPSISNLDPFYLELIKSQLDYVLLKKSLASLKWAREKTTELSRFYMKKAQGSRDIASVKMHKSRYIGRTSSVIKQIKDNLEYLEHSRRVMRTFPVIKPGLKTVALYGFPNVGKTTLLSKITTSKPEIADYAFTTKILNVGYMVSGNGKVQIIDTPGSLNRPEKMNPIEFQADLALRKLANAIVVVMDPTETYDLDLQLGLLKRAIDTKNPVVVYFSKTDIASKDQLKDFSDAVKVKVITDANDLMEYLKKI